MAPDIETDLDFSAQNRSLWPALVILKRGREPDVERQLSELILQWLRSHRLMGDDDVPPDRLKSPADAADVTAWLHRVWQRLAASEAPDLLGIRRSIMEEVAASDLNTKEQADLFTALDYLCRLASARMVAAAARPVPKVEIPNIRSHAMQAAYRSLAKLAASDLPIWLSGEKGVELEGMALLIHRLRGLSEATFHILDADAVEYSDTMAPWNDLGERAPIGSEVTLLLRDVDEAPRRFQRMLYRHLLGDLGHKGTVRIVVTTGPLDLDAVIAGGAPADLFAFLNPMRVEIPPLRSRTRDLEGLISFHARSRGLKDPVGRFTPEALEALRAYHWPGNAEELEMVLAFVLEKRPNGVIGLQHLPQSVLPPIDEVVSELADFLGRIVTERSFRILNGRRDARLKLAKFLHVIRRETFTASDIQGLLQLGRDTVRRLLGLLETEGLVEGIKGSQGKRTTRYRCLIKEDRGREEEGGAK